MLSIYIYLSNIFYFFVPFVLIFVLALGLVSCQEDKSAESFEKFFQNTAKPWLESSTWRLKEPQVFTHKDQSQSWPVKTFNEAATSPLKITYGIRFLEIPAKATLAIKSSCYTREQSAKLGLGRLDHSVDSINSVGSIKEWRDGKSSMGRGGAKRLLWKKRSNDPHLQPVEESWVRELRPWLNFWELIPRQMYKDIHLPLGQDEKLLMVCNMDFTVENKDGVKHSFDFREISIFGSSDIYESMQPSQIPVFVSEPKLGEIIKISGFAKIFENIRKTDLWRSYLFCEAFQISPLPLEFIEEDIPSLLASKYGEHFLIELLSEPQRECRFVVAEKREESKESKGLHGNVSYVKFLSKNFKLEFPVLQGALTLRGSKACGCGPVTSLFNEGRFKVKKF